MGKVFSSAMQLAAWQLYRGERVKRSVSAQFREEVMQMKANAVELTSGGVSEARLRKMGHPFARRNTKARIKRKDTRTNSQREELGRFFGERVASMGPNAGAYVPKLPINRQSGQLQRSLRLFHVRSVGEETYRLQFSRNTWAIRPGGTRYMVARGFWQRMRTLYRRPALRRMRAAYRKAMGARGA